MEKLHILHIAANIFTIIMILLHNNNSDKTNNTIDIC